VRISPEEREAAERRLQDAVAHGVLDFDEFNDRIGVVLEAKTSDELHPVLADLPRLPVDEPRTVTAFLSDETVDLRDVLSRRPVAEVTATAMLANVKILVPPGTRVELSGFAALGSRKLKIAPSPDGRGPLLRLEARALLADVVVRTAERLPVDAGRVRKVAGGALVAAAAVGALIAGGAAVSNADLDAVSVFGSSTYQVPPGDPEVRTLSLFGSAEVVVPEGTPVQPGGLSLFGSTDCSACQMPADPGAEPVAVRSFTLFGSTEISTPESQSLEGRD
jgi:hypothetical protein